MPPHGRRRSSSLSILLSLLFLFAATAFAASSAVIGIDLGTEYIKASLVKPGVPLDIILTRDSKRKEVSAVAFKSSKAKEDFPERIYGGDAGERLLSRACKNTVDQALVALSSRFPKDVYPNLKQLLGLSKDSPIVTEYGARYPELQIEESFETGTIGFRSDSFAAAEAIFTVEELLAMELKSVKANAEHMAGKGHTIEDAVITIPGYFTARERKAVATAVELAGLRPISLLSDGLAVGLNYATSRTFPIVNEGGKPEINLIYDVGAGSATATVLKFQGKTVKDVGKFNKTIQEIHVLGSSWDRTLGGDALNRVVLDDMLSKFIEQPASKQAQVALEAVRQHGRTMSKLWKESERIRQVLSANSEAHANFEGLFLEDLTFKYKLTRTDFESLSTEYQNRVEQPALKALEMAKLEPKELDSIILHGGAVRTPSVQRMLEKVVSKDKIRTNVNSDEAAVLGAGFRSATISPSFRVKEIKITDIAQYPVFASWKVDEKEKTQKLFVPTSAVGPEKQVSFNFANEFEFLLSQQTSDSTNEPVTKVQTLNLTDSIKSATSQGCAAGDLTPKFNIRLSPFNGLPEVVGASITCEGQESEKKGVVDGMKDFLGFGSKKDEQQKVLDIEDESSSTTTSSQKETKSTTETGKKSEATGKPKEAKKKQVTVNIGFSSQPAGKSSISTLSIQRMQDRLTAFDASDLSRVLRAETLNSLEAYTYKVRDLVEDEAFITASTSLQRDEISKHSSEISSWLYEDGAEASRDLLKEKLDLLRGLVKPIQKRLDESKKRPEAIKKVEEALKQAEAMGSAIKTLLEKHESEVSVSLEDSASAASSSSSESATTSSSATIDEFADLDETSTSTSTTTPAKSAEPSMPPLFTENDLNLVEEKRSTVQKWLDEKLAEQEKLGPTDDPVLLTSDLKDKVKDLEGLTDLLIRRLSAPKNKPPKSAKSKKSKSRTKETETSTSTVVEPVETDNVPSADPTASSAEAEPTAAEPEKVYAGTDDGEWSQASESSHPGEMTAEEELKIRQEQQRIDDELAAERISRVNAAKASQSIKDKKAKESGKAKSKKKSKSKSKTKTLKPKGKSKEDHEEL